MSGADRVLELERENARLSADLAALKQQLEWFKRQLFGPQSEKRLDIDPAVQGNLFAALEVDPVHGGCANGVHERFQLLFKGERQE